MQLGGLSPTEGGSVSASTWDFTVPFDSVAEELLFAMSHGGRIEVHYKETVGRGFCHGSTGYDVLSVASR